MNKDSLVTKIAARTSCTKKDVNAIVDALGDVIIEECRDGGETVTLPGVGTFKQKSSAARMGRNPMTGESIKVKASTTIKFTVSSAVKC